jgi:hypothetical protein
MRGCGSRTIRARSHSHSQNHTTNSGFTCERTKASPAHDAGEACLLEAVPDGRRAEATRPVRGHPDARRHQTPAVRASRHVRHEQDVGHREWRAEPADRQVDKGTTATRTPKRSRSRCNP